MSNKNLILPTISKPRYVHNLTFDLSTSFNHGDLIPLDAIPVLPGDEFNIDVSSLIRMSTPIAPIFGNIFATIRAFFVPMRLVWDKAEEFFGANKTTAGIQQTTYTIPQGTMTSTNWKATSISAYLGKPKPKEGSPYNANVLKERGYSLIWSEYYRAEQLQSPITEYKQNQSAGPSICKFGSSTYYTYSEPLKVNKIHDYFTSATLSPQFGNAVTIPLGRMAPILADSSTYHAINNPYFGNQDMANDTNYTLETYNTTNGGGMRAKASSAGDGEIKIDTTNLYADLNQATAAKINDLRFAFMMQNYLEKANFGGNRFFEILQVHYGTTSPDSTLQIPQRLGEYTFRINVNQVTQVTGWQSGTTSQLGNVGAVSVTGDNHHLTTQAFTEPGYLYILISTKHERSYSQGLMREDSKKSRFEIFCPEFNFLGDQAILNKEIYVNSTNRDGVFGYAEHWQEYKERRNRVTGILNPDYDNALDFWTLADKYENQPTLDENFIVENRSSIARALVTGATGPDYIADFNIRIKAIREVALHSLPGLYGKMI